MGLDHRRQQETPLRSSWGAFLVIARKEPHGTSNSSSHAPPAGHPLAAPAAGASIRPRAHTRPQERPRKPSEIRLTLSRVLPRVRSAATCRKKFSAGFDLLPRYGTYNKPRSRPLGWPARGAAGARVKSYPCCCQGPVNTGKRSAARAALFVKKGWQEGFMWEGGRQSSAPRWPREVRTTKRSGCGRSVDVAHIAREKAPSGLGYPPRAWSVPVRVCLYPGRSTTVGMSTERL